MTRAGRSLLQKLVRPVGPDKLGQFYLQLATMLDAGLPMADSLRQAGRGIEMPHMMRSILAGIEKGASLHRQLSRFPYVFAPWHLAMIRAGEQAGDLPGAIRLLADDCDEQVQQRKLLRRELINPLIAFHLLFFLWPLPALFAGTIGGGEFILRAFGVPAIFYIAVFLSFAMVRHGTLPPDKRRALLSFLSQTPVLGPTLLERGIARFGFALRSLYRAGVQLADAVPIAAAATGNDWLADRIDLAAEQLAHGATLHSTLASTECFPKQTLMMIEAGEVAGRLDDVLDRLAIQCREQAIASTGILTRLFSQLVYGLVGLTVALWVILTFSGYLSRM